MPTTLQQIITDARVQLNEPVANLWQDTELLGYLNRGIKDLRRHINQTHQDYVFDISTTVTMPASTSTLSGVPTDLGHILNIEPQDMDARPLVFQPKAWEHADFQNARARDAIDPGVGGTIFYRATGVGAPGGTAATIRVAPQVSAAVALNLTYRPVPANLLISDNVPLPGDADQALIEWVCAYALARERGDSVPDKDRMTNYGGEVTKILVAIAPRDESEPQVVDAMFAEYW